MKSTRAAMAAGILSLAAGSVSYSANPAAVAFGGTLGCVGPS